MRKIILILSAFFGAIFSLGAQNKGADISGVITCGDDGSVIDFAYVIFTPSKFHTMTDADGKFSMKDIPAGDVTLSVEFYGMEKLDTTIHVKPGESRFLKLRMKTTSFELENVTVVATQNKAGSSTASNISRQAMDHMQTSSLYDILSLIPGGGTTNPDLSTAQSFTLRTAGGTGGSVNMNSLGTAILVDGAPMSNNANMQVLSSTVAGSTAALKDGPSVAAGVDMRGLSTDNVESVEVIRGIPSVEYGDITTGAVLVKSKAGKSPLVVRFKTNPNIYQISAAKGLLLSKKAGDLNISADYAYSKSSLTQSFKFYQRANLKGLWTVMLGPNTTENTSLTLNFNKDTRNPNVDVAGEKGLNAKHPWINFIHSA